MGPKSETIILRVDPDTKRRIEEVAKERYQSMTSLIIDSVEKELRRPPPRRAKGGSFRGVPTFFRACCVEASSGGTRSYADAGWHFGINVARLVEPQDDDDRCQQKLDELQAAIDEENDERAWAWCKREFPRCMKLVPSRRREQFLRGLYAVAEDREITAL